VVELEGPEVQEADVVVAGQVAEGGGQGHEAACCFGEECCELCAYDVI